MKNNSTSSTNQITQQLLSLQQKQFTGRLDIKSNKAGLSWRLYFGLGRLVWADGGCHANRSWQRHLVKYFPHIRLTESDISQSEKFECWNYYILSVLLQRREITREQLIASIESKIDEVMFDVFQHQQNETDALEYSYQSASGEFLLVSGLKISLAMVNVELAIEETLKSWLDWCEKDLEYWSPNLAPILTKPEELRQEVSQAVYQNFVKLINGKRTLRDLAVYMNRDLSKLAASLGIYIRKGYIELQEIPDWDKKYNPTNWHSDRKKSTRTSMGSKASSQSLIACIDDSPQICKIMEKILKQAGYRYIGINESLKAIPTLISASPDLIFLDIGMPIVNGYELCTQLRRVTELKDIPIVILTGNDGIIDRVRAKMSGASGFISKPIEIPKILSTAEQFLSYQSSESEKPKSLESEQIQAKIGIA
ncbi:MAG: response regulator [Prochloraceae cyanobacterium]|nr:response regulator [Prochloraceae cyanobacterium]